MNTEDEAYFLIGVLLLVWLVPSRWYEHSWLVAIRRWNRRISYRKTLAIFLVMLCSLSMHFPTMIRGDYPVPQIHDEFSYLLAADTFAQGRVTNDSLPNWKHFESMHIIVNPTYTSKYPPGQSVVLALGDVVFGHPIFGVWICMAVAAGALCWMLQAWVPPHWAFWGSLLVTLRWTPTYWGYSYWGGALAALGSALVFGALRRLCQSPLTHDGFLLGLGIGIWAATRPYEGLVLSAFLGLVTLCVAGRYRRQIGWSEFFKPALGAASVLALIISSLAGYHWAVTGSPFRMPYQLHNELYASNPTFLWQSMETGRSDYRDRYHNKQLAEYHLGWEVSHFEDRSRWMGFNSSQFTKLWGYFRFYIGPLFAIPCLLVGWYSSERWLRFASLSIIVVLLALSQTIYFFAHYAAPIASLTVVLAVAGFRYVNVLKFRGHAFGRGMVFWTGCVFLLAPLLPVFDRPVKKNTRSVIQKRLEQKPGKDLVIVSYDDNHKCHFEWVYNDANIDESEVIWARSLSPQADQQLIQEYSDRRIWTLKAKNRKHRLKPLNQRIAIDTPEQF